MLWRSSHGWERQGRMACDVIGLCVTSTIVKSWHDQPGTSIANLLQESKKNLRTRTRSGVDRSDMHHTFSNSFMIILHVSFPARSVWVDVLQAVIWWEFFFWLPLGILGILPACLPAWDMQYMGDDESNDKEVVEDARASESRSFTLLLELQVCHSSTTTSLHSKTRWFSWPHSIWPYGN